MYVYMHHCMYVLLNFSHAALQKPIGPIRHGRARQVLRKVPNARRRAAGGIGICWPPISKKGLS